MIDLNVKKQIMTTTQIVLASRPKGLPTLENFKIEEVELRVIRDSEVLLEGIYYSVDPCPKGWIFILTM